MPVPADDTLPVGNPASGSNTQAPASAAELLQKFRQLNVDAQAEEADGDEDGDEEDGEGEGEGDREGTNGQSGGANGDRGRKKKKKKKGKGTASKAVAKLKSIAGGSAPQEVVDAIRANMDSSDRGATDGMPLIAIRNARLIQSDDIKKAMKAMDLMKILDGQLAVGAKIGTKAMGEHKFWKTQPVPQLPAGLPSSVEAIIEGPIDPIRAPGDVKQEPGQLPSGFEWCVVDILHEGECKEVYELLSENYVEDDDAMFRFKYSKEFFLWALTAPGYNPNWHIGVRVTKTRKLVAFISGIKIELRVRSQTFDAADINFLCVHKKLRSRRLAPVLIKEVTRRCNLANIWQAIYTGGVLLPTPIGTCRYHHRNLNPPKLVDIGFSPLPRSMTVARLVKQYSLPSHPRTPGFREMAKHDLAQVSDLLRKYLARFDIAQTFSRDEEVEHWFLSGQGRDENGHRVEQVVWAYVVEDPTTHLITDFMSFYSLPSSIMKHKTHEVLNAAYLFWYASDAIFSPGGSSDDAATHEAKAKAKLGGRLNALVNDVMVVAKNAGFDVVNALTLLDNNMFLTDQKFGPGDGYLNYYLYNWACAPIDGGQQGTGSKTSAGIGMVML